MSAFTKTLIVDADLISTQPQPPYFNNIAAADDYLWNNPGTIIVEAGTYNITNTIEVPSNNTIIGRGGVVVNVTESVPAFRNRNYTSGTDSGIILSGLKIQVSMTANSYASPVIAMKNVSNSVFEKLYITTGPNTQNGNSANSALYFSGDRPGVRPR